MQHVGEIHLAGHAEQTDDEGERLLLVADAVWKLFEILVARRKPQLAVGTGFTALGVMAWGPGMLSLDYSNALEAVVRSTPRAHVVFGVHFEKAAPTVLGEYRGQMLMLQTRPRQA